MTPAIRLGAGAAFGRLIAVVLGIACAPLCAHASEADGAADGARRPAAKAAEANDRGGADELATTTATPWNPPVPIARRRTWEQVVLLPGRIVSLPLSGLGRFTDRSLLFLEERGMIPTGATIARPPQSASGVKLQAPGLYHGGLGAAVLATQPVLSGRLRTDLSARYAGTLRRYNSTRITATGHPFTLQYGYDWRPEERFYGLGNQSSVDRVSDYAAQSEFVRASVGREWPPAEGARHPRARLGAWVESRNQMTSEGRKPAEMSYDDRFPEFGAATRNRRVENLIYGASMALDSRAGVPHWGYGSRLLLSAERHGAPVQALALRDGQSGAAEFDRYLLEAETGFSFMRNPRTVRVLLRLLDQDVIANGDRMMPADMATLGGKPGLAGYGHGRFHDLDLLHLRTAYLFPIARRLEIDLHSEWGAVYSEVWQDAKLNTLRESFGVSLRGRYDVVPVASIGLDFSREAVRVSFAVGGLE